MKKSVLIGLVTTAVLAAVIIIPRHMSNPKANTAVTAEATNPGKDASSSGSSETKQTNEETEKVETTTATAVSTEASNTNGDTAKEENETTTSTAAPKKVMLKSKLDEEVLDQWLESYIESTPILMSSTDTTIKTTTTTTSNDQTATETTDESSTGETTETTAERAVYKDIVLKRVLVKPEREEDGLLLRDEEPEWQLILEYREEYDGVRNTKLLAAPADYFDPMNPLYEADKWYFPTKSYVKIGEEYYKPMAVIDAIIVKFKINVEELSPYNPLVLMAYTPKVEEAEDKTEEEAGTVLYDEQGNEYIVVDDES